MEVLETVGALRSWIAGRENRPRVLVPTMGALHAGHASLLEAAASARPDCECLVSIFVNPTQFGPGEDYERYPRTFDEDLALCESRGAEAVFAPEASELYPADASVSVAENRLSRVLCGASRVGHFDGVCTIVAKLFLLASPAAAVFGEKDYQQLAVIRRLVRDLHFPVEILAAPTVREADGLAMSSRNRYLSPAERLHAAGIHRALREVAAGIANGALPSPAIARSELHRLVGSIPGARIDYLEIADSGTLESLERFGPTPARLLAAVHFGSTRLIDNVGVPKLNG